MGKLVAHEVDVVALRSFRPKDYADVGCSQEDSALITQAIRANPSPAAKPTVDLPDNQIDAEGCSAVGTENADVPQPVILDGANPTQQQPPSPLPAAGVGGLQSISAEEAAARLQGGGNGMVELAPGEAEMRHQQFLFEQQQQAQAMMYMQDGYPQHYQQQAPYPPPQFAPPNPYYAQPMQQQMMPTQQQMMMSMMQPPMMYPNEWSRAPFGTWFCGCCGCPNHPNAAICGGCNEPHRLFAGHTYDKPPSAFSRKKKKGGKKKQHKKKPATPTHTLQKRDSPPATPSSSPTLVHSDRQHDAPHGLRDTDEKEKQDVKIVESKPEDGKSQPEPEDSEEEPELLFGSESVDAADETETVARQLDDQFAETEKHAKV